MRSHARCERFSGAQCGECLYVRALVTRARPASRDRERAASLRGRVRTARGRTNEPSARDGSPASVTETTESPDAVRRPACPIEGRRFRVASPPPRAPGPRCRAPPPTDRPACGRGTRRGRCAPLHL
ncbi:hypothetical protein HPB47_012442 [Ixodes persulcatus]|uniref:Uncharacterized protein n=1 Tax=Ixodes persulcatus TaxID=34615 RepID=A0AC60NTK4_IXOPE|nr:hypothetical protein HPB47_012442 [Ixodes persulcatus]